MTNGKQKPLVPITREFLKQFYQKYPLAAVPNERLTHLQRIEALAVEVTRPGSKVPEQVGMPSPTRIDDCFWRNRMICEELALSMSSLREAFSSQPELAATCTKCHDLLVSAERSIFAVQERNTSSVKAQLQQFIPQDFRGALLERQRVSTEARYKKQVDDLVKRGGTIRQRYDLYLQQQWERRQSLVQLGECSGMYKMVIKWVAGIPQVLLDFAKEINAKLGPMEEQRIKYGPDLYGITELGIRLDVCLAAWAEAAAGGAVALAAAPHLSEVVEPAIGFYCEHMLRVVRHIGDVFQHSPFFVNKDDLETAAGEEGKAAAAATAAQQQQQSLDAECGSSILSAGSASGDYGAAAVVPAAALAAKAPPLPVPLSLAPSVTAPSTPGIQPEAPAPRSALMLSPSSSDAAAATSTACPEKQQLHSRFDAKAGGAAAATISAVCGGSAAAAPAAASVPLHRAATPPPRELAAAACGHGHGHGHGHGAPPSGSRQRLSTMSVESHVSFLSAMDQQTWFLAEEGEEGGDEGEGEGEQGMPPRGSAAWLDRQLQQQLREQQQQHPQQRSSASSQGRLPHLQSQPQQPQPQPQRDQDKEGQSPRACASGGAAAAAAAPAQEATAALRKEGEAEAGMKAAPARAPAAARPRPAAGGCFSGCLGGGRRASSSSGKAGSRQQHQQQRQTPQQQHLQAIAE